MKVEVKKSNSGTNYIEIPSKIAEAFIKSGNKRIICSINSSYDHHCAIMRVKNSYYYLAIGKRIMNELNIKANELLNVTFKEDKSELQFEIPEEFREVFETDPEAQKIFNGLTDGNKRGLIALVLQVKSIDKKIERSLKIAEKLKYGIKSPQLMLSK